MAGETQGNVWPLPNFRFSVDLGDGETVAFQEVQGLSREPDVIEYRQNNSKAFTSVQIPGLSRGGNVTMRGGIFAKGGTFWNWFEQVKMNTIERRTVIVSLLDQKGSATMVWTLENAFPTKITGTDLKSEGNKVAVETIEFAYEKLTIAAK